MLSKNTADIAALNFVKVMADQISMPEVYHKVRSLIEDHDSNIMDFVEVIRNDSSLSVKLSRITDSNYFGYPRRAEDLYQAISLIGIMQLHDLMLNSLCLRTFLGVPHQLFNPRSFWEYSVKCGIAARTIAQYGQIFPINPFFTYGLLHEVGHAAMFIRKPELSLQVFEDGDQTVQQQREKERNLFGFDYTDVGVAIIRQWQLPEVYEQVISFHLDVEKAEQRHQLAVRVIHLAHQICQTENRVDFQQELEINQIAEPQLRKLPDNIATIINKEIETNTDTVLNMLWPGGANRTDEQDIAHS